MENYNIYDQIEKLRLHFWEKLYKNSVHWANRGATSGYIILTASC